LKPISALIHSHIYISLGAVLLTVSAQIQLGMKPQWHPWLFLIFFATLFEYNIHRLVTVLTNNEALKSEKYHWIRGNLTTFYVLVFISFIGFVGSAFLVKKEVLIALAPLAILTFLYSIPVFGIKKQQFSLREIPYLKIFLIAFVWSSVTILLPVIQSDEVFDKAHVVVLLTERFFFIFAIAIPFDVRDLEADKHAGIKTIPLLLSQKKALTISFLSLLLFFLISFFHYQIRNDWFIIEALGLSALTTYLSLRSEKIKKLSWYYHGVLDGALLLQGFLVLGFYYFTQN
jgi:4-hydroxybenzoate polyprenyltransferase